MARDIDREVAKELGFYSWFHNTPNDMDRGWKILGPDNHTRTGTMGHTSEEAAWALFLSVNKWSSCLSKAWELMALLPEFSQHLLYTQAIRGTIAVGGKWTAKDFAKQISLTFIAYKHLQENKDVTGNQPSSTE